MRETARLAQIGVGARARIRELPSGPLRARLASLGLVAGSTLEVLAQRPAAIVRVGSTMLALEPNIGERILVDPIP